MPSTALTITSVEDPDIVVEVLDPLTGELVNLITADLDDLAGWLDHVREYKRMCDQALNVVQERMYREIDPGGQWTVIRPNWKITGTSPAPTVKYDGERVYKAARKLVKDGLLTKDAAGKAVERVVSFKARVAGIQALSKISPVIAAAFEECSTEEPKLSRGLNVKPNA